MLLQAYLFSRLVPSSDATSEFDWCVGEYQSGTKCNPTYYVGHAVSSADGSTVDLVAGEVEITPK